MASTVRKTNWFAIWVSVAAVVVLVAVTAIVIAINNQSSAPGASPQGKIINTDLGAVTFTPAPLAMSTICASVSPAEPSCGWCWYIACMNA